MEYQTLYEKFALRTSGVLGELGLVTPYRQSEAVIVSNCQTV